MKKQLLLTLVLAFFAMFQGFSQTPIVESFEGTWPPQGWTITGFTQETQRGFDGQKSAVCDYSVYDGRIILPSYVAGEHTTFSFYVSCEFPSWAYLNTFTVEVSTSVESPSWTVLQTISYPTDDITFLYNEVDLSSYAGQEILISIHVVPNDGADTYVDLVSLYENLCPRPNGLTATSTMTSAQLTWVDANNAGTYTLQVIPFDADWATAESITVTGDVTYEITDLTPATTYKARVLAVCAEGESLFSDEITFNTSCSETLNIPYTEDFNNLTCWTILQSASNEWGEFYPEISDNPMTGGFLLQSSIGDVIIANNSPIAFEFENTIMTLEALAYYDYSPATIQVGYVTSLTDAATFVPVNTFSITDGATFGEYSATFEAWELEDDIDYYLAMKISPSSSWDAVYINKFIINEAPDCPAPQRTSVNVVPNATNAVVSWVDTNEEHDAWIVYYKESTAEEWLTAEADDQTYTLTGLTPQTTYQVYVMTDCGTDDNTDATYTVEFTTTSTPITLPYFQNFEDTTAASDFVYHNHENINTWKVGTATAYIPEDSEETIGGAMYISNDNGVTNAYTHSYDYSIAALLVEFAPGAEYTISFDYKVDGEQYADYFQLYALDPFEDLDNYWNGQTLTEELYGQTEWTHFEYTVPSSWIGSTKQILFYWHNNSFDGNQPPAAIDNLRVTPTTCVRPNNIEIAEITSNTVTITWEGEADNYNIGYRLLGSTQPYTIETTAEDNITLTDLLPATAYEYAIQSVCDDETSPFTSPIQFFTECEAIEGVWYEDFESVLNDEVAAELKLSCWSVLETGESSWNGIFPRIYWEGYAQAAHSGEVTLEFKGNGFLLLPEMVADLSELQLTFFANTTASTVEAAGTFEVGYVTDPTDTTTFVLVETVAPVGLSRSSSEMVGPFLFTDASEGRIALRYRPAPTEDPESWNLDDFKVEPIPNCPSPDPYSVTVSSITDSEAIVAWTDSDETHSQWVVFYKTDSEETYTEVMVTEQQALLTGLTSSTRYTVYVQTYCGTEENLSQTNPVSFYTTAVPITEFPYFQDFEDIANNPLNVDFRFIGANQWVVGSAAGSAISAESDGEQTQAMYISNNNGQSHAYGVYTESYTYASVPITFGEALEYNISFDYKSVGEGGAWGSWDFLTVVLADENYQIPETGGEPTGVVILNRAVNVSEWTHVNFSSSQLTNTNKKLIFYWENDAGASNGIPAAIDNLSITTSDCPSPASFTATIVTANEATFTWAESEMTSWTLYYKSQNETSYTSVEVTENPFTLTDLNPMTGYTAYLVTNCESEESVATSIVSFETACSIVDIYPYSYGFETEEFLCWTNQTLSETQEWNITESQAPEGSKYAKYQASSYSLPSARLISPIFDLSELANPYVKFTHKSTPWDSDIDELKVQYRTSPAEEWVDLVHYTTAYSDWTIDSLALPNSSEEYQIAFLAISHYGYGVCLDAITVYDAEGEPSNPDPEPEPCDAPTNLTVSNITENSADVSWNGTASTYELKVNGGAAETLTTTTKTLTGLTANTAYTVEVRAVCEDQTSDWVTTNFTTLEEIVTPEPCDAPTNLTVNNITANSADVTWNGTAETYELKLNGGEAETLTTTSKQLIGLPENFTITVEVRSICGNQQSEWVSTTFTTLDGEDPEPQPCDAPTNLSASNITETSAEITWNGTASTYEFKLNGGEAETITTTTKTLTGLTANTAYTVEVRSICEDQQSAWVTTNFTTLEEQVVIVLGEVTTSPATNLGNTSVTLNGALVSAGESENFTVGFALSTTADFTLEDAGVENITATLNANTFSQAVNDLTEGQTYFYRAYITNEAGTAYGAVETFTLLGLNDAIAGMLQATIYPNPATDNATLEINGLNQEAKVVVSDLQGRILSQDNIKAGTTRYTLNVSNMSSGVYYIRIITDNVVSTQKLIVE